METSRNYNDNLPAHQQRVNDEDPRERLYEEYGLFNESFEDFCDRMSDEHGNLWVWKFKRA